MAGDIMTNLTKKLIRLEDLRQRAQSRLAGPSQSAHVGDSASAALDVLHKMALTPGTAENALALLHELQVHQVEIDIQAEELRTLLADADAELDRQLQYQDSMPVACFNIDGTARLLEANLTGARWLGLERTGLLGQNIKAFLTPSGAAELRRQLDLVKPEKTGISWETTLLSDGKGPRTVQAIVSQDAFGGRYILVLMDKASVVAS